MGTKFKLSYTVESNEVYAQLGQLIGLMGPVVQAIVDFYNETQKHLATQTPEEHDLARSLSLIGDFREELFRLDTRLDEVTQMILGIEEQASLRAMPAEPLDSTVTEATHE